MTRVCIAAALSVALTTLAPGAVVAEEPLERLSIAFETSGLAYGLAVGLPRISVSALVPIQEGWSIQVSPAAAWGGDAGSRSAELALPVALRAAIRLGPLTPYAAAGVEVGWGRLSGRADILAAGSTLEAGGRLSLFGSRFFFEPYVGGALMVATVDDSSPTVTPSLFGGVRIGLSF
jgi:opacity protein-like surface antigen